MPGEGEHRVAVAGVGRRFLEPGRIVGEAERVGGPYLDLGLFGRAFIEQYVRVLGRANSAVEATAGAHVEIPHELLAQIGVAAGVAFFPRVRRDLVLLVPRQAGLLFLLEPSHTRNLGHRG